MSCCTQHSHQSFELIKDRSGKSEQPSLVKSFKRVSSSQPVNRQMERSKSEILNSVCTLVNVVVRLPKVVQISKLIYKWLDRVYPALALDRSARTLVGYASGIF